MDLGRLVVCPGLGLHGLDILMTRLDVFHLLIREMDAVIPGVVALEHQVVLTLGVDFTVAQVTDHVSEFMGEGSAAG